MCRAGAGCTQNEVLIIVSGWCWLYSERGADYCVGLVSEQGADYCVGLVLAVSQNEVLIIVSGWCWLYSERDADHCVGLVLAVLRTRC